MNIHQIRKDTIGCESLIHLNNAGAALMPKPVTHAIRNYTSEEETGGGYEVAEREADTLARFYSQAAKLLGSKTENMAFTASATDGFNRALSSIPFASGDVILTTKNDYPSNFIAFLSLQKRFGVNIVLIENTTTGEVDLNDLEQKLKQYSPKLLSVSHVPTSSGLVQPVTEIGKIVSHYNTLFLLDACQSLGQLNVTAADTGADFISGTFRKFLRGPRGAGLLYVSDKVLSQGYELLLPDARGADWVEWNRYEPISTARRFEDWENSYALMSGSTAAIDYLLETGIEAIEERNALLTTYLREALEEIEFIQLLDKGKRRCSIVTFTLPMPTEADAKNYFRQNSINIFTTSRASAAIDFAEKGVDWALRVSPHYYNTEEEIDAFVSVLKALRP